MNLYNKYRPTTIDQIIGNSITKTSLLSLMARSKKEFPAVLLFHGPAGCGKTTLAQIIASHLGVYDPDKSLDSQSDYYEIDSAQYTGIEHIRELRKNSAYLPSIPDGFRIWVLDEVHRLSGNAQDALLKLLEKPPNHCRYILCTTEPNKLLKTVQQRCIQFKVDPLDESDMIRLLHRISKNENKKVTRELLAQITQDSLGSPREAIQILDKIIDLPQEEMAEAAKKYAEQQNEIIELCRALVQKKNWKSVCKIIKGLQVYEAESVRRAVLGYCNSILLNGNNDQASFIIEEFRENVFDSGWPDLTNRCYRAIK